MKKLITLLILCAPLSLFSDFCSIKEKRYSLYYPASFNPFTVEYIFNLIKTIDHNFTATSRFTNQEDLDIFLYDSRVAFMKKQSAMWWENYLARSNRIYINNVDLLMEKNYLHTLMKFLIARINLTSVYRDRIPAWLIAGLSVQYAGKGLFSRQNAAFGSFQEVELSLSGYKSREELETAYYLCFRAVRFLLEKIPENELNEYLNTSRNTEEFRSRFINLTGMTYAEFMQDLLTNLK